MSDWSNIEVDLIIADYFSMLNDELAGKKYNKSEHRVALLHLLKNRNEGAIEFKHQNISAAMIDLGLPYIKGYKPLFNYQLLLIDAINDYVEARKNVIEDRFQEFANDSTSAKSVLTDFAQFIVDRPDKQIVSEPDIPYNRRPIKINYLQREQTNRLLGEKGEQIAIAYEKWSLIQAGKEAWADQIQWISQEDDGAGFDILSKNLNGTDKYIEVKTTKLTRESPFYFSANEYNFSKSEASNYHLYRVFDFAASPKMFKAQGCFDDFCFKEPTAYKGSFQERS